MTTLKDLVLLSPFNEVWEKIVLHYSNRIERKIEYIQADFRELYKKLHYAGLKENHSNMFIYIDAFETDENDEPVWIKSFDENNKDLYFDVSGRDDEHIGYSLVGYNFNEWLNFYIDSDTLHSMSAESLLAHCLWEMTFGGYDKFDNE
ncbi:DUF6557 family protein [Peribacillus deserti]|uniref:Uncharacterized protein n=1 Tax=Peribacillus deserti TaxID=673318 RepID=A0A2N5M9Q8_9BACI|nr:DUF6557 family protein [Peribacillus deserti]PLT31084.1 hypothetical protein CUU66_04600 [Peribacillus deserti]